MEAIGYQQLLLMSSFLSFNMIRAAECALKVIRA